MSAAKQTIDHQEIQRWVESHGGHPATVARTRSKADVGLIRIDFPGFSGEGTLQPISWEEWFSKFDAQGLAFLYQTGKDTNFNKLVRRESLARRASDRASDRAGAGRRSTRAGGSKASASHKSDGSKSDGRKSNGSKARRASASPARATSQRRGRASQDLQQLTKSELLKRAQRAGVRQRSGMNKGDLVRALQGTR
jgi:hypothetical protein